MAYSWADIYRQAAVGTARAIEESRQTNILNRAQNLVWRSYDWRFTIAKLAPFWCEPYIQEYGSPIVTVPTDMERLSKMYVSRITSPKPVVDPLRVVYETNFTDTLGIPAEISFMRESRTIRLWPTPSGGICAPNFMIFGNYKTLPTRILTTTYDSVAPPTGENNIEMWLAAVKWAYAEEVGDKDAGEVQVVGRSRVYTGKLAKAMAMIQEIATNEGLNQGNHEISPSESMVLPIGTPIWY